MFVKKSESSLGAALGASWSSVLTPASVKVGVLTGPAPGVFRAQTEDTAGQEMEMVCTVLTLLVFWACSLANRSDGLLTGRAVC